MEQKELAIHVDRVSKVYKLYRRNRDRLIESLGLTKKKLTTPPYALKDVSLDISEGRDCRHYWHERLRQIDDFKDYHRRIT